jgi:hypothetical protein
MRRGLELIVDEAIPGHFYWFVLDREVFGQPRRTIDHAPGPYPTHKQAIDAGTAAMRRHMEPKPMSTLPASAAHGLVHDSGPATLM